MFPLISVLSVAKAPRLWPLVFFLRERGFSSEFPEPGVFMGDSQVCVPQDISSWKLGGRSLALGSNPHQILPSNLARIAL